MRLLSVARSLAIQATKIQARDDQGQLAALLALQAFRFNERYGGSSSDPDIYNALQAAYTTFDEGQSGVLRGHADGVRAVAFAPGGGELASAGDDGAVRLWSLRESTQGRVLMRGGRAGVRSLAFDASGHLAVGTTAGAVWFLDLTGNAEPQKMASDSPLATISALSYAKDGRLVAVDGKGGARVYPAAENWGQALVSGDASGPLYASAVGGSHLAIGGDGGRIWIWETENWQREPQLLEAGGSTIRRLAFSADGSRLAAGTHSGDLLVWEGSDWAVAPQQLLGHSSSITGLSFHGDGHLLASSSLDRTVRIWNVKEGGSITIAQDDWVWDVAFSPDGRRIASAGADRTVRIWHAHVEELAAVVETHITREMTTVEWQDFVGEDIPYEQTRLRLSGAAP